MTSQFVMHRKFNTYRQHSNVPFKLKFDEKSSFIDGFSIRFNDNSKALYFLGHLVCKAYT